MTLNEIREALKGLITDKSPIEFVEKIAEINNGLDDVDKDMTNLMTANNDLKDKYIKAVTNASFKGSEMPKDEGQEKPLSFEECIEKATKK